jgi:hypothetical protein
LDVYKGEILQQIPKNTMLTLININLQQSIKKLTIVILSLFLFNYSYAGAKTWTGATSTDWATASNWSPSGVPGATDDITIPITSNSPILATGTYKVHSVNIKAGGSFTQSGSTLSVIGGSVQVTGTFNQTGGSLYSDHDFKVQTGGVFNQSGSALVSLAKDAKTVPNHNFAVAAGGTVNQAGGTIHVQDYGPSPGTFNQTGSTALLQLERDYKAGPKSVFSASSGTIQFSGNGKNPDFASGTRQFANVVVDPATDPLFDRVDHSKISVSGNFTNNSNTLNTSNRTTFYFNGSSNQTIYSAITNNNPTLGHVVVNSNGGTVSLSSNVKFSGNLTVNSGTLDLSTYSFNRNANGGTFKLNNTATLRLAGSSGGQTGSNFPTNVTTSLSSTSTVEYYGAGSQTIYSTPSYGNLTLSGAGTKTAPAALNIKSNFTMSTATFVGGSFTHNVGGNWTMTSGTFTNTGNTINFNGTGNQTISSTGAFNGLTINKASGSTTLGSDVTASTLTLTKGILKTGNNKMIIPNGGSVVGAGASTGWVNGNLQKYLSASSGSSFEVGGQLNYDPLSISSISGLTAGSLVATTTGNAEPNVGSSTIASKNISRYWTVSKPSSGAASFTSANLTFNWTTADNYPGMTTSALKVAEYSSSLWSYPVVSGSPGSTSITATGITTLGDFAVGEISACTVSTGFYYSSSILCSNAGTATVILNTGATAGTFSASPAGLSINSSTGAINLAASTPGIYTITNTVTSPCASASVKTIQIVAASTATISYGTNSYCQSGGTASVNLTGTAGGTFSSSYGLVIDPDTGDIDLANSNSGTYTVTYTVSSTSTCSSFTTTTTVTVTDANYAVIGFSQAAYCTNGGTVSVDFDGTPGGTFTSTAGLVINSSTGAINLASSTPGTYVVSYNGPAMNGCTAFSDTASITITSAAPASVSYLGGPFCADGGIISATVTGNLGGVFYSTSGLAIDSTSGDIDLSSSTAGTYTVTYDMGGCYTTTSVTVNAAPSATINYSSTVFCKSVTTAQLPTITGSTGGTFSSTAGLTINTTTGAITPSSSTAGTYTITYTVAAANGCSVYTTTTNVTIIASPSATISYAGTPFCSSITSAQPVTFTGNTGGVFSSSAGLALDANTGAITPSASTSGTYTVTYTIAGCSSFSTSTTITVTAAPAATIAYTSNPYCNSAGSTASVTITGTTGGTFTSTAGLVINASSGLVDAAASTPGTYTVTYTIAASSACAQYQTTTSITINQIGTWTGTLSTDWNTAGNWVCNTIPNSTINAIIPSGLVNYPIVSSTGSSKNLTIQSGASVTVNNSTLQIAGVVSAATGSYITATNGNVEFNGASAQTIPENLFSSNTVKGLIVTNAAGVTVNGAVRVTGTVAFGNVNNSTLTSNGYLTLVSTSSGTARLTDITNNGANTGNQVVGNVTVERYVQAKRAYRFLTAPVNSSGSIKANWMENSMNPDIWNLVNPNPGYGTEITGTGDNANGFDPTQTHNPSMFTFNNLTQVWSAIPNTNALMKAGSGYRIIVRGDRSVLMNSNDATPSPTTLRATGTLVTGNVVMAASGGTAGMPALSANPGAYNFIGNPYAAPVNWSTMPKTNLSSSIYIFDPTISGSNGRGAYVAYNAALNTNSTTGSLINNFIQSGQAFFVQTTGASPSVTFRETDKIGNNLPVFRTANDMASLSISLLLPPGDSTSAIADGAKVYFSPDFDSTFSDADSYKFTNLDENLAVMKAGRPLSIEGRNPIHDADTIPLKVWQLTQPNYSIRITLNNFADTIQAFLYDKFLNTTTAIAGNETVIPFSISSTASSVSDRFKIVFKVMAALPVKLTGVKAYQKNKGVQVEWSAESESNIDHYEVERSIDAVHFEAIGSATAKNNPGVKASYRIFDQAPIAGDNFYRIKTIEKSGEIKYSEVVKVPMSKTTNSITVFPNPISGKVINVVFSNLAKGNYNVSLITTSGQKIYGGVIEHAGGTANHPIVVDQPLSKGVYQLQITGSDTITSLSVLVQ